MKRKARKLKKLKKSSGVRSVRQLKQTLAEVESQLRLEQGVNSAYLLKIRDLQVPTFHWTSSDGRTLAPKEMEESHLRNTICYLQRKLVYKFGSTRYLKTVEHDVQALYEMLKEARRRGIDV